MNGARSQSSGSVIKKISELLEMCGDDDPPMPPKMLYCEGWLLRLVLDWHKHHSCAGSPLAFEEGAKWYSEGRLSTPFRQRPRGQCPKGDGYTNVDGFIGHFSIDKGTEAKICPKENAKQLVVVEAKLGSGLSSRTDNAEGYDQAARNACCLAYMAAEKPIDPKKLKKFAFYVIAPSKESVKKSKIDSIDRRMTEESISEKIKRRASDYGEHDRWYEDKIEPFLNAMRVEVKTWEEILVCMESAGAGAEYREFYKECLCRIK
ncbi:MAG: hypothetical protein MPK75_13445 [Alphaproteobacteria bacterium]|nr:hypothetical protein [Alphaproteobacteria bacterium]